MATMITNDCINCGACEPECPNNAISQGETIFVIDPKLCTECVGFHDYEACAAVCPVDCCVTDPNNIETEEVLIARARALHQDVTFGEDFPSRFRKAASESKEKTAAPAASGATAGSESAAVAAAAGKTESAATLTASAAPPKPAPAAVPSPAAKVAPPPVPEREPKPKKTFDKELPLQFEEVSSRFHKGAALSRPAAVILFLLQPLLGAMPHGPKKRLEEAVGNPIVFSAAGSTGLNILHNAVLYPLVGMVLAAILKGPAVLFSQEVNSFLLVGLLVAALEGVYRLRDGVFRLKPADEMKFPAAIYGGPLALLAQPMLAKHARLVRDVPIPVDGFYSKGFDEKLERERRYGNVYTIEDRGGAYLLRLEFPRWVPDLGLPAQAQAPREMPDYDYDLILKEGQFIIKGRCTDERIRKMSSSIGAFPPEFTTVVPLREPVGGFVHRMENKMLEVFLIKDDRRWGGRYH